MAKQVHHPEVREGYDRWSQTYDATSNPLVALDRRYTMDLLQPGCGERILDAGCGTGANLKLLSQHGSWPIGVDFSRGMLNVARRSCSEIPMAQADLNDTFPVREQVFDAILCALVGEHLTRLPVTFRETFNALVPGGRFVFSVFHPEMAAAGIEANFAESDVEYRLGAQRYTVDDYLNVMEDAGFHDLRTREFLGDDALVEEVPGAEKYLGRPLLLVVEARKSPA